MTPWRSRSTAGKVQVQYHVLNFLDDSSSTELLHPRRQRAGRRAGRLRARRSPRSSTTCSSRTSRPRAARVSATRSWSPTRCRPGRRRRRAAGHRGPDLRAVGQERHRAGVQGQGEPTPTVQIDGKTVESKTIGQAVAAVDRPSPGRPEPGVGPGAAPARLLPMPDASTPSPYAAFVAGLPKAEIHVHHVGSASPRIVAELAARHPGVVPSDLDALARLLHVPRLRALHRGLPRGRRPAPRARGHPAAHLRGGRPTWPRRTSATPS